MVSYSEIQFPRLKGERTFQTYCLKLVRRVWDDPYAQEHGRRGQSQHGADITGADNRGNFKNAAMQCKGSETHDARKLSVKELIQEVEKASSFEPKLDLLIVAYAGDRDEKLQKEVIKLNQNNEKAGLFKIVLWCWDDIVEYSKAFDDVIKELIVQNGSIAPVELDPKRPKSDKSLAFQKVESAYFELKSLVNEQADSSSDDPVAAAKIDVLRDQIVAGNGHAVIDSLRDFIQGFNNKTSPHIRFRAYANLGAALTQAGLSEQAGIAFDEAAAAEPRTAASHAYKARAALVRGQRENAYTEAETALSLDGDSELAAIALIESASDTISTSDLENRFSHLLSHTDVGMALSGRFSKHNQHADALRIARQIPVEKSSLLRDMTTAQALLHSVENNLEARIGAPVNNETEDLLSEAKDLLEVSWNKIIKRADKKNWIHVAANLCSVYRFVGEEEKADNIALEAYELSPEYPPLIERATLALMHRNERLKALELAYGLAENGTPADALFAGNVAAWAKDWPDVSKWAQKAYDEGADDKERARAAELLILAIQRTADAGKALSEADNLRSGFSPNVAFEARAAELARRVGENDAIEKARQRIALFDSGQLDPIERFELADAYADDGNWIRAAELLEGLHSLDRESEILRRRLFALYRADLRKEARDLYQSLKDGALKSKEILGLGAAIYERSGMLPEALKQLDKAISLDPNALRPRLDWARLLIRNGNEQKIGRWIRKTSLNLAGEPDDILELAQLLDRFGRRKDALKLGYDALSRHWGTSERLHMMFISLFLMRPGAEAFLFPKTVAIDTVVSLENEHKEKVTYRIEADRDPSPEILSPDHRFAEQLNGAKVGDTVTLSQGIGETTTWKVVEIKHKYLDLFHKAMTSHQNTFPGSRTLGRVRIDPTRQDAFEPVFEQARERARVANEAARLYKENPIPIDAVARMLGLDLIDASTGLRFRSDIALDTCLGTHDERESAIADATGVDAVLVDPVTLSIWQHIGFLPILENIQGLRVELVQSTLDMLAIRVEEARNVARHKGGSLEAHGDQFTFIEPTKKERKAYAQTCAELLKWCRDHAVVVPTESLKNLDNIRVSEVLFNSTIDTLGTSLELNRLAIIEDKRIRMLAQSTGIEKTIWTQAFLIALAREERLSHEKYIELIANLYKNRVGFIAVSFQDLSAAAVNLNSPAFKSLSEALTQPAVDVRSLIVVLSEFLTQL